MTLLFVPVALSLLFWSLLDLRDREIEDAQTLGFCVVALVLSLSAAAMDGALESFGSSLFFAVLFALFGYALYKLDWWGGADVKLAFGLGLLANARLAGFSGTVLWPAEVSFFLNLCLASILYFALAEAYLFATTGRMQMELPYVPAMFLAWLLTGFFGDVLLGALKALGA